MNRHAPLPPCVPVFWLWSAALILAASGTWIDFAARPGINWALSTFAASAALLAFQRTAGKPLHWQGLLPLLLACLLAGGAAVTTSPFMDALILMGVTGLLGTSLLIVARPDARDELGAAQLALSPVTAGFEILRETGRRVSQAAGYARAEQSLPVMRGIALAVPITAAFGLLLASADPVLSSWRDSLIRALRDLAFVNRTVCFIALGTVALGSLGQALAPAATGAPVDGPSPRRWFTLGATERLIILGPVVALFGLFFALQLSHVLGTAAALPGSGVTFAQAAHQGFGELTIAASLCAALLIAMARSAGAARLDTRERALGVALILEAQVLLLSAFHRITLYEAVYGFTELRLLVQCYAGVVLVALALLGLEILGCRLQAPGTTMCGSGNPGTDRPGLLEPCRVDRAREPAALRADRQA